MPFPVRYSAALKNSGPEMSPPGLRVFDLGWLHRHEILWRDEDGVIVLASVQEILADPEFDRWLEGAQVGSDAEFDRWIEDFQGNR